jgi:hypothetical protein
MGWMGWQRHRQVGIREGLLPSPLPCPGATTPPYHRAARYLEVFLRFQLARYWMNYLQ